MDIEPPPFWANLSLSKNKCHFIAKLIKDDMAQAKKFHETFRSIDDLCTLNGGKEFQKLYKKIYPQKQFLNLEHDWISL